MFELKLITDPEAGPGPTVRIGGRTVFLGRGSTCDLVLPDDTVSGRHAALWRSETGLLIEDLRSRNGTFINGQRLQGRGKLVPGDIVQLGEATRFRVGQSAAPGDVQLHQHPQVQDVATEVAYQIRSDRFVFGSRADADVPLPQGAAVEGVLMLHGNGEVWLGRDGYEEPLAPGQQFEIGGRSFCLRLPERAFAATREVVAVEYPYSVLATLNGALGAEVRLRHTGSGAAHTVKAQNRAILLYLLCRKLVQDTQADGAPMEPGWLPDEDIAKGIWGRKGPANPTAHLNVLIWRTRKELETAGFDPWCIEKRNKHLRLRVQAATVDAPNSCVGVD